MDQKDRLPLELRAAHLALHGCSDMHFAKLGVTAEQFVLLATLVRGDALTQRELAARMPSDPSTVRAMLVLLEKRGLRLAQHASDRWPRADCRSDSSGVAEIPAGLESLSGHQDQMVSSLSAEMTESLVALLRRVSESLADASMVMAAATNQNGN
jgi:hypothetical protein